MRRKNLAVPGGYDGAFSNNWSHRESLPYPQCDKETKERNPIFLVLQRGEKRRLCSKESLTALNILQCCCICLSENSNVSLMRGYKADC